MREKIVEAIKSTAEKATLAKNADESLKYTQAVLNAVHALVLIQDMMDKHNTTK